MPKGARGFQHSCGKLCGNFELAISKVNKSRAFNTLHSNKCLGFHLRAKNRRIGFNQSFTRGADFLRMSRK